MGNVSHLYNYLYYCRVKRKVAIENLRITAASIINSTAASNTTNSSRTKRLSAGASTLYPHIADMEVFHQFKLKETQLAQSLPNAISPFRYLAYTDELAPLSGTKVCSVHYYNTVLIMMFNFLTIEY